MAELSLRDINLEIQLMKKMLLRIQESLGEKDLELSDEARERLLLARETSVSEYISHEDVKKKLLTK